MVRDRILKFTPNLQARREAKRVANEYIVKQFDKGLDCLIGVCGACCGVADVE